MKILILDSEGMVGYAVKKYFTERGHDIAAYDDNNLNDLKQLKKIILKDKFDAIINCAAVVNQYAEYDKVKAIMINSLLPHYLEEWTAGTSTVVVHRSTDCVFSGKKGQYSINDNPDGESFYAKSKALGEIINEKDITIRTSLIGPDKEDGESLLAWFLRQQGEINGYANAIWTGLTTKEFAREIEKLLMQKAHGLFHLVPDYSISKYELLELFEKYYPMNRKIKKVNNDRIDKSLVKNTGDYTIDIPDYEEMIKEISNE